MGAAALSRQQAWCDAAALSSHQPELPSGGASRVAGAAADAIYDERGAEYEDDRGAAAAARSL